MMLLKTALSCVLGRVSSCGVPKRTPQSLPAALLKAVLSSLYVRLLFPERLLQQRLHFALLFHWI